MKIKKIFILFFVSILIFSGCSGKSSDGKSSKIIRVSNGQPMDHPDNIALLEFKKNIEKNTNGRYEVLIYPNELLGASKNALELCQTGALEFVVCSSSNMETFNDIYSIFSIPYIFDSEEAYHEFMNSEEVVKTIYDSTEDEGLKTVAWFDAGVRNFYCQKPIKSVEDLKGMKIRVQPSPTNVEMMKAFEAAAVPMSYSEVYTAIQNGTIDGAENSEMALTTVKHGEVIKYYSYNKHQMVPDLLVSNVSFLNSLSEEDKEIFNKAFREAEKVEQEAWNKQISTAKEEAMKKMGVEFVESDVMSFKKKVIPLHEKLIKENAKLKPVYEQIQKINEETSKRDKK